MANPEYAKRKLCKHCDVIDFHLEVCTCCGHNDFLSSDQLEDGWIIFHRNQRIIAELQKYLDKVTDANEKFESQWFKDWNNTKAVQRQFGVPESFPELENFLED